MKRIILTLALFITPIAIAQQTTSSLENFINQNPDLSLFHSIANHHYFVKDEPMTWTDSKNHGDQIGVSMYVINNQAEENEVFSNLPINTGYWLGLYQDIDDPNFSEPNGGWKWVDGSELSYTNWFSNEPNNIGGEEYAEFNDGQGIQWNDEPNNNGGNLNIPIYEFVSFGDILLNGTVSAENNQIKNVADPTEAQDAVTMAYLQTKLDELSNRVKYLEDTAPNNQPSGTWTKVFDSENLPQNFDFTSMQKVTQYSYNKSNKEVYFLNRNNNSLFVYDIDMNTFNEINVDYQISSGGDYIYNPHKNTIEYLRAGRETVYEIDLSSYASSLVKTSGSDTSHYGASMFYNPFTSEIGQIFGYGWYRVKNSMANLNLENGWEVSIADSESSPQRRTGAHVFPTKDYKKIIVLGGHGNQSGSQTEDSCSNPNTSPWASDVGVWCFQSDIWEIDLADYSVSQISDFNIGMKKSSVMSYNYDKNIIINYAGILPPATYSSSYSQEVANWDFSLLFFDINNPNLGWQEQSQSGDLPSETLEKGYFIYDESSSLFYYFRNDGVWTLSM